MIQSHRKNIQQKENMDVFRWTIWIISAIFILKQVDGEIRCDEDRILCPNGQKCIPPRWICDGGDDCKDKSDETYCTNISSTCSKTNFLCSNGRCYGRSTFCDKTQNCGDYSDEFYCNFTVAQSVSIKCPVTWMACYDNRRCVPQNWMCDGVRDCLDGSDETMCKPNYPVEKIPKVIVARRRQVFWFLKQRKNDSSTNKWGHNLHRIATALYLGDENYFLPGNKIGDEISYELTNQLLYKLSGNYTMRTQELALYIHALLVTCIDPRYFFGHNLVLELRRRVESSNYTNPFSILALCNAEDDITEKDVEKVTKAFDSHHRPFWTDTQAIATMALGCISLRSKVKVDERVIKEMQNELKKKQFRNGTVDNLMSTALVVQALLFNESYNEFLNLGAAIDVLLNNQKPDGSWGSVQNSYYVLPVLNNKNLMNISNNHCRKSTDNEEEFLTKLKEAKGKKFFVQYSVWIGGQIDLARTWRVRILENTTFYDVIEIMRKLDSRHNVTYNVIDGKPYVSALYGKQEDSELGIYWFTYVKSLLTQDGYDLIETSPVDVTVQPNQELVLWYKPGSWGGNPGEMDF